MKEMIKQAEGIQQNIVLYILLLSDTSVINLTEDTALHWSARWNKLEICNLAIDKGVRVDQVNSSGLTPLQIAGKHNNFEVADLLINRGAKINSIFNGSTLVEWALVNGNANFASFLTKRGARNNKWVPDNEVSNCCCCKSKFTIFRRKHHCRRCGNIMCGDCSVMKSFPKFGHPTPVPSCKMCSNDK